MISLENISQITYAYNTVNVKENYTDDGILDIVKGLTYQKLLIKNGYSFSEESNNKVIALLFFENNELCYKDSVYHVVPGDVLLLLNIDTYNIGYPNKFKEYVFYFQKNIENNIQNNTYTVLATLTDNYKITISADSRESALEIAYGTPLDQWIHLKHDEESNIRPIIRKSSWGNLRIEE